MGFGGKNGGKKEVFLEKCGKVCFLKYAFRVIGVIDLEAWRLQKRAKSEKKRVRNEDRNFEADFSDF